MKVACTVWNGGKGGDCIKSLPIVISYDKYVCWSCRSTWLYKIEKGEGKEKVLSYYIYGRYSKT